MMTPNNILNMAMLKKLDFVAVTDHNSAKQLETIREIEKAYDFIVIPGIEVTVSEGFDVLCYFDNYDNAILLDRHIEQYLIGEEWGVFSRENQVITDIYDIEVDTFDKPLLQRTVPYKELYHFVKILNGRIVLAHINRNSKSVLQYYNLDDLEFDGVEIEHYQKDLFIEMHPEVLQYPILTNSDAHSILQLSEREEEIELEEKSINALFEFLKGRD